MTDLQRTIDLQHLINAPRTARQALLSLAAWIAAHGDGQSSLNHDRLWQITHALGLKLSDLQSAYLQATQATAPSAFLETLLNDLRPYIDERILLVMMVGIALADGDYDARQRSALRRFVSSTSLSDDDLIKIENQLFQLLENPVYQLNPSDFVGLSARPWTPEINKRKLAITAAILAGALIAGLSGLHLAPTIQTALSTFSRTAAPTRPLLGLGTVVATRSATTSASTVLITALFGLSGAALGGTKAAYRTADLAKFDIEELQSGGARVILGISGFLSERENFHDHWRALKNYYPGQTVHALRWESQSLRAFGKILATLPLGILSTALNIIDNPWSVARDRAQKAGRELANTLRQRPWGARPLTLVGFSLGARVIVHALAELSAAEISNRVESVFLLGGAVGAKRPEIDHIRHAVTGPVVNGYCPTDAVLNLLYRGAEWESPIGLGPLNRAGILDVDLSSVVNGHTKYNQKLPKILAKVTVQANAQDPRFWVQ